MERKGINKSWLKMLFTSIRIIFYYFNQLCRKGVSSIEIYSAMLVENVQRQNIKSQLQRRSNFVIINIFSVKFGNQNNFFSPQRFWVQFICSLSNWSKGESKRKKKFD